MTSATPIPSATAKMPVSALSQRIGETLGESDWITMDQSRVNLFAECTMDDQWIHTDVERARRESPFGGTVAHGFLLLSLLAPTGTQVFLNLVAVKAALNYGLDKVRFVAPVLTGKRVRNRIVLVSVEDKGQGRYLVTTENTLEIEHEAKPALIATSLAMLVG